MKLKLVLTGLFICTGISTLMAQNRTMEVGFQTDNDSYLAQGSDKYYTNGLFLFFRKGMDWTNPKLANKVLTIEVGQKIFNPQSGYVPDSTYIDRPFAGYLYAGGNINYLYRNESNLKLGVQVGVIGKSALGEQAQKVIHNTFGFYQLNGWQYQIRNNFQLNLQAEYNRLLTRPAAWVDLTFSAYANAGTGFNGAGAGGMVRLGNFNQLFNSVTTQSTATNNSIAPLHKTELYFYYQPMANYIAYDASVQGNLLKKEEIPSQITGEPKPFVVSHQAGVAFATSRIVLSFAAIFRNKEVEHQVKPNHSWGSLTFLYRFSAHTSRMDVGLPGKRNRN